MTTKEKIEVMQAYLEGKTIEITNGGSAGSWETWESGEPTWNWGMTYYRVKREPGEWFIPKETLNGCNAAPYLAAPERYGFVRVREVIE